MKAIPASEVNWTPGQRTTLEMLRHLRARYAVACGHEGWPPGTLCGTPEGCTAEATQGAWYLYRIEPRCDEHGSRIFAEHRDALAALQERLTLVEASMQRLHEENIQLRRVNLELAGR